MAVNVFHSLLKFQCAQYICSTILNPGLNFILQAQSLSEVSVDCGSANILTLAEEQLSYEGMLSIENPDHDIIKKSVVYHSDFTKKRKIIFLAKGYTSAYPTLVCV